MNDKEHSQTGGVGRALFIVANVIAVLGLLYVAAIVVFFLFAGGVELG